MSLRKEDIRFLAGKIVRQLKGQGLATFRTGEDKIEARIEAVFQKNIDDEMAVERETKRLMDQYRSQISSGAVDAQRAYSMIRKQVAKERKFIP